MNSELIKAIDEAISDLDLNEAVTDTQGTTLLGIINKIEGTNKYNSLDAFKQNPWPQLDNKWDKLTKEITTTQRNHNESYNILKVYGATKNGAAVPDEESYILFDSNTQSASLTTKDKATPVNAGWLEKRNLGKNVGKWLENNPRNEQEGYIFEGSKVKAEKVDVSKVQKNQQLDYTVLAEFYFNIFNNNRWNDVPSYWKVSISNDLYKNQSLISSLPLQFMDKALRIKFFGKDLIEILSDEKVSQLMYLVIIVEGSININSLDDKVLEESFILSAILSKCFNGLSEREAADLLERFTRIKNYYGSMKTDIQNIIAGENDDQKAEALAENAIVSRDGNLENNPFIQWSNNTFTGYVEKIPTKELIAYTAVTEAQLKRVLTVIMDPDKQNASAWYLVINNKHLYKLNQNKEKLTLATKDPIKFYKNAEFKIVFAPKEGAASNDSRIGITEINNDTIYSNSKLNNNFKPDSYFELDTSDNTLSIKDGKGFTTDKFNATIEGAGRDQKVVKIEFGTLQPLDENDTAKDADSNTEQNTDKKTDRNTNNINSNITETQAKDAIKKYLYKHRDDIKIFTGRGAQNKIADFIDAQTFNGKSLSTRYKAIINSVIKEIQKDPKLYNYNTELNEIKQLDGTSMLDVLIDILNGNMSDAIATKEANEVGQNIPSIKVDKEKIKDIPEVSAQTIANKLDSISSLLKQDATNATNKASKDVMNKISKGELSDIIRWFNDRYSTNKKINVDSTANKRKK